MTHSVSQSNQNENLNETSKQTPDITPSPSTDNRADASTKSEKQEDVPSTFRGIDFKNFSYPISGRKASIRLKDGKYEYSHVEEKDLGDGWFDFEDVSYVDLVGKGEKEAVVRLLWVQCGGSCDGGSHLFYFYSLQNKSPALRWRIETGSAAYTCGLKSFELAKGKLTLEAFRSCSLKGVSLESAYDADVRGGKFIAPEFTQFVFEFNGGTFDLKQREVFPNTQHDVKNYDPKIIISND